MEQGDMASHAPVSLLPAAHEQAQPPPSVDQGPPTPPQPGGQQALLRIQTTPVRGDGEATSPSDPQPSPRRRAADVTAAVPPAEQPPVHPGVAFLTAAVLRVLGLCWRSFMWCASAVKGLAMSMGRTATAALCRALNTTTEVADGARARLERATAWAETGYDNACSMFDPPTLVGQEGGAAPGSAAVAAPPAGGLLTAPQPSSAGPVPAAGDSDAMLAELAEIDQQLLASPKAPRWWATAYNLAALLFWLLATLAVYAAVCFVACCGLAGAAGCISCRAVIHMVQQVCASATAVGWQGVGELHRRVSNLHMMVQSSSLVLSPSSAATSTPSAATSTPAAAASTTAAGSPLSAATSPPSAAISTHGAAVSAPSAVTSFSSAATAIAAAAPAAGAAAGDAGTAAGGDAATPASALSVVPAVAADAASPSLCSGGGHEAGHAGPTAPAELPLKPSRAALPPALAFPLSVFLACLPPSLLQAGSCTLLACLAAVAAALEVQLQLRAAAQNGALVGSGTLQQAASAADCAVDSCKALFR